MCFFFHYYCLEDHIANPVISGVFQYLMRNKLQSEEKVEVVQENAHKF